MSHFVNLISIHFGRAFYFSRKPMIYSKPVFSLAEGGSGNLGLFPGSEDKEQRGLECCCPPQECRAVPPPALREQTAGFSPVLPAIHPASSVQRPHSCVCREGLPSALPTGCFPNPCHSTHKHIHTRSASLTHGATRTRGHIPPSTLTVLRS